MILWTRWGTTLEKSWPTITSKANAGKMPPLTPSTQCAEVSTHLGAMTLPVQCGRSLTIRTFTHTAKGNSFFPMTLPPTIFWTVGWAAFQSAEGCAPAASARTAAHKASLTARTPPPLRDNSANQLEIPLLIEFRIISPNQTAPPDMAVRAHRLCMAVGRRQGFECGWIPVETDKIQVWRTVERRFPSIQARGEFRIAIHRHALNSCADSRFNRRG